MNKKRFLSELRRGLSGLPQAEVEERLTFYSDMIDDRMEDGCSESTAVAEIGPVKRVVGQILSEISFAKLVKRKIAPKKPLQGWEILLLVLGSPLWLSLVIAAVAVVLAVYTSLWAVAVSLWACFGAVIGSAVGGLVGGIILAFGSKLLSGLALVGAGIFCAGLSIFLFAGCKAATKGMYRLTKALTLGLKRWLVKKEVA